MTSTVSTNVGSDLALRIKASDYIASNAGSMMVDLFHKHLKTDEKNAHDYVTELDRAIESMALKTVMESFPDDGFEGEENAGVESKNGYSWVVDPIDGTNNFVRGLPLCGFQLAILRDDQPVYSIISRPFTQETFTAKAGAGAFYKNILTGEESRITVSERPLGESMVIFDAAIGKSSNRATRMLTPIANMVAAVRVFGVAVFDIPSLASGVAEVLITGIATKHDIAPGALLLAEAGGQIYSLSGDEPGLSDEFMILSNSKVKPEVLNLIGGGGIINE